MSTSNNIQKTKLQITSTNRFLPLDNLKVHQKNEFTPVNNSVSPPISHHKKRSSETNKIPRIINGIVKSSDTQNSYKNKNKNKILKDKPTKNTQHTHKVHITGDSHFKGIATRVKQYLDTNFAVSSFIKPGASVKQIVDTQEMELRCLGMKDLIVVNGGSNDLANNSGKGKSALLHLLKFVQKYANTMC